MNTICIAGEYGRILTARGGGLGGEVWPRPLCIDHFLDPTLGAGVNLAHSNMRRKQNISEWGLIISRDYNSEQNPLLYVYIYPNHADIRKTYINADIRYEFKSGN